MCKKKEIISAIIIANEKIAEEIYKLRLGGKRVTQLFAEAKAGQFVNIYLKDMSMLLPRPISLCLIEKEEITLVYRTEGAGTKQLATYEVGTELSISSPLGNGYMLCEEYNGKAAIVCGGGIGIPPMLQLAKELKNRGARVVAVFGYRDEAFLTEEAKLYCEEIHIASDSGSCGKKGNVVELMETQEIDAEYCYSCGPKVMLRTLTGHCSKEGIPLQVSLEERMGCGFGACVGCACKIKEEKDGQSIIVKKGVCKDGPVFYGSEVVWE